MIDKVQKIREEVERIQLYTQSEVLKQVLDYIDEVQKEPVSEDLEEAAKEHRAHGNYGGDINLAMEDSFKLGSNWKEQQMIANAIDAEILENYNGKVIKYDDTILDEKLSNCKVFDKVKVILIKGEEI